MHTHVQTSYGTGLEFTTDGEIESYGESMHACSAELERVGARSRLEEIPAVRACERC